MHQSKFASAERAAYMCAGSMHVTHMFRKYDTHVYIHVYTSNVHRSPFAHKAHMQEILKQNPKPQILNMQEMWIWGLGFCFFNCMRTH